MFVLLELMIIYYMCVRVIGGLGVTASRTYTVRLTEACDARMSVEYGLRLNLV